jgi:hypothetical protein
VVEEITAETSWLVQYANQEHIVQSALAKIEAAKIAKLLGEGRRSMNGLGQPIAEIPAYAATYWAIRKPGCWKDAQFVKEFLRDNPECRVKSKGTKEIMVGYGGLTSTAKSKRFYKAYG